MRLCLNMIVRNESAILERCLLSVLPHIDCYVICDTGSSDDTVAIVERVFSQLPGEVHHTVFENFGQARNEALHRARSSPLEFDYILLIDADMELKVEDLEFRRELTHAAYLLRQKAAEISYDNFRLLARRAQASYQGSTHEYLAIEGETSRLGSISMLDHACGSSRAFKSERDLRLLTDAVRVDPKDVRSLFYLAQTLREAGRYYEAISAYERRVSLGGWPEEVWYSRFMIAYCQKGSGDIASFISSCLEAYQLRPTRAEPLYALAKHYREAGLNELCCLFSESGLAIPLPDDALFIEDEVYRTGLRYEMGVSGFYSTCPRRRALARRYTRELAVERDLRAGWRESARANWRYHASASSELFPTLRFVPLELPLCEGYHPCNPSVARRDDELWCVVRSVNYSVRDGVYEAGGDGMIRTENHLLRLDEDLRIVGSVPMVEDPPRPPHPAIEGLEDVRLIVDGARFRGSATIVEDSESYQRRIVVFDLSDDGRASHLTVQEYGGAEHQKNWIPFVDSDRMGFLYWMDPTTVLEWGRESRQSTLAFQRECPVAFENQRGSSGAVPFDHGWLVVTHEVSYPDGQRTYLHRFIQLDANFVVIGATEPFYFQHLGVEFCCGLSWGLEPDQLIASFGVEDREAWLVTLQASEVRAHLQPLG